jgi:diguanylate cyclase (GGDEF)-like protein
MQKLLAGEIAKYQTEKRYLRVDGKTVWVVVTASLVRDADGRPLYFVSQMKDISERKRYEEWLRFRADHDPLTGLPNRRRFEDELSRKHAHAARYGGRGAVLMLDLDNLKEVNDSFGHHAGDRMITTVAELLQGRLRRTDVVARLGGDEFAALLPEADEERAWAVASTLLAVVRAQPLLIDEQLVHVSVSVGIALFEGAQGWTSDELLAAADAAMYEAKQGGRDRVAVHRPEGDGRRLPRPSAAPRG